MVASLGEFIITKKSKTNLISYGLGFVVLLSFAFYFLLYFLAAKEKSMVNPMCDRQE
jgi:hypothetical protein